MFLLELLAFRAQPLVLLLEPAEPPHDLFIAALDSRSVVFRSRDSGLQTCGSPLLGIASGSGELIGGGTVLGLLDKASPELVAFSL